MAAPHCYASSDFQHGEFRCILSRFIDIRATLTYLWRAHSFVLWCNLGRPKPHIEKSNRMAFQNHSWSLRRGYLVFLVYIPKVPDPCSRSFTDEGYEECVSDIIVGMPVQDARDWLEAQGYRNSRNVKQSSRMKELADYDSAFQAFRSYGPYYSIPYGTNFLRLFGRIPPAPSSFQLVIRNSSTDDKVVSVQVWWAFSFL
ncbi:MAG: hypothetical protein ACI82I_002495 [Gammaproteobacteria bacterium]